MTRERWQSYWYQLRAVLKYQPKSVLEIGCGAGATTQMLRRMGIEVTTFDFDARLNPDIAGDVRQAEALAGTGAFDLVCAFQVLEHIPYGDFRLALAQLGRIARRNVIVSLPHWGYPVEMRGMFFKKRFSFAFSRKLTRPMDWTFDGQHHWELGTKGHSLAEVRRAVAAELPIRDEYFCPDYSYHYFFELDASHA
ncbi:MAG TPA: class I SAM-dependent methyltransferase, partial [Croceibacterium sp.]